MTRKRFIKLLMAKGCSRDGAASFADYVQMCGDPYAEAFQRVTYAEAFQRASANEFTINFDGKAFAAAAERAQEMIAECIAALAERMRIVVQSMNEAIANAFPKEGDTE